MAHPHTKTPNAEKPTRRPSRTATAKDMGLNAIQTYVFWNAHEPLPDQSHPNWEGNLNLTRFIELAKEAGLYVVLRIGPYGKWISPPLPLIVLTTMLSMTLRNQSVRRVQLWRPSCVAP